jgi:predicted DNA-binding transcriptional regulator YafY
VPRSKQSLLPLELEEALDLRKPVVMEYLDARQFKTERIVEPLKIRRFKGELTLVAWCRLRQAQRTFKLDRIVQLRRIDADLFATLGNPDNSERISAADSVDTGHNAAVIITDDTTTDAPS